jgi:two-component system, sensor histidine kinase and response regulator
VVICHHGTGVGPVQGLKVPCARFRYMAMADAPRVLLVEDETVNQMVIAKLLEVIGAIADVASNGAEALRAAAGNTYDLVLMDCHMPVLDGFAAARAMRGLDGSATAGDVPIIALTASNLAADVTRCLESGMNSHLSKPVLRADLERTVARYVL